MAFPMELFFGTVGQVREKRVVGKDDRSVINFSVAYTPRAKNSSGEWVDKQTIWRECTVWGKQADYVEKSFKKGDRVFVYGQLNVGDPYTDKNGDEHPGREFILVEETGLSVLFSPAHSDREARNSSGSSASPKRRSSGSSASDKRKAAPKAKDDDFGSDDWSDGDDWADSVDEDDPPF